MKQHRGKTAEEANKIAKLYKKLWKDVFNLDIRILKYRSRAKELHLEFFLAGMDDAKYADFEERQIPVMNSRIGYSHKLVCDKNNNCILTITESGVTARMP